MKTPIEVRKKIVAAGMWKSFTIRKDLLKLDGMASGEASRTALLEFELGTLPEIASELNHAMLMNKARAGEALEYVSREPVESAIEKPVWSLPPPVNRSDEIENRLACATEFTEPVTSEELSSMEAMRNRKGGEIDNFRWVANNMEFTADVDTCPGPAAWGLLKQCQTSAAFKQTFWTTMYTKLIPTRSKLDGQSEEMGDGENEINLLADIEKLSTDAKAGI